MKPSKAKLSTMAPAMYEFLTGLMAIYKDTDCPEGNYGYHGLKALLEKLK